MSYTLEIIFDQINVTSLILRNDPFSEEDIPILIEALRSPKCAKLTELDLRRAETDENTLIALCDALAKATSECSENFPTLTSLLLANTPMTPKGAAVLVHFLQTGQLKFSELDLSATQIGNDGAILFKHVKCLRILKLAENKLKPDTFRALAENEALAELDLSQNEGGDAGAAAFKDTKLRVLNLEGNGITALGVLPLAGNTAIRSLFLSDNPICSDAGLDGAELLAASTTFEVLILNNCNVGLRGAQALGASRNENLSVLFLHKNKFGDAAIPFLAVKKSITHLGLEENNLTDAQMRALAENETLVRLYLTKNKITDTGAKLFIELNHSLTMFLHLNNDISQAMDAAITAKVQKNADLVAKHQEDINVFIYEYHIARKLLQTTNKALAHAAVDVRPYLLLLPLEVVSHILTFLPYSYLHKTSEQIKTHFTLFNAFMSAKAGSLMPRLKEQKQQGAVIIGPLFLNYQRECKSKREADKTAALPVNHSTSPNT